MKRVVALVAVAVAIAWCGASFAGVSMEEQAQRMKAMADGTYPLEFAPRSASSGNSVLVESVSVPAGETGTVGVYITNDVPVQIYCIPLIIRSIDPGSFITYVSGAFNTESRLDSFMNGEHGDTLYFWPVINTYPNYVSGTPPYWGSRNQARFTNPPAPPDYESPDGLLFARGALVKENALPAGSDGVPGDGNPMITITFRANLVPGQFEIDTCLTEPDNHIIFVRADDPGKGISPEFTKGIITIEGERETAIHEDTVVADPPEFTGDDSVIVELPVDSVVVDDPVVVEPPVDTTAADDPEMVLIDPFGDTIPPLDSLVFDLPDDSSWVSEDDGGQTREPYSAQSTMPSVSNYPNPFNAATSIRYSLDGMRRVSIEVYDLLGRRVITLVDAHQPPGEYTVPWDGRDAYGNAVGAGIYFYRVQKGDFQTVGKMVLLK